MASDATEPRPWTVIRLRSRWKPTKERLSASREQENLRIRFHRACSWLQRVEDIETRAPEGWEDDALVLRWVAFNSLYGRLDEERRQPESDFESVLDYVTQVLGIDEEGRVVAVLGYHRDRILDILEDDFITKGFWKDPDPESVGKAKRDAYRAQSWYVEGKYSLLTNRLLQRIYMLRCQLVHGAASRGGDLNRVSVARCCGLLGELLPVFLLVMIDHGVEEDWGKLCYPPIR